MIMFEKLEAKLNLMGSAMSSIAQDVHNIGTKVGSLEAGVQSIQQFPPLPTQRDINKPSSQSTSRSARVGPINQPADVAAVPTILLGIPTKLKVKQQLIVQQMTIMRRQRDTRLKVQTGRRSSPLL